jgi:hypothetical protein
VGCRKVSPDDLERLNACSLQYERASRSRRDETLIIFRGPQPLQPLHKPGLHCSVPLIHNNAVRGKIPACNLCSSAVDLRRRTPLRCIPVQAARMVSISIRYALLLSSMARSWTVNKQELPASAADLDGLKACCHFEPPPDLPLQREHNYNDSVRLPALQP